MKGSSTSSHYQRKSPLVNTPQQDDLFSYKKSVPAKHNLILVYHNFPRPLMNSLKNLSKLGSTHNWISSFSEAYLIYTWHIFPTVAYLIIFLGPQHQFQEQQGIRVASLWSEHEAAIPGCTNSFIRTQSHTKGNSFITLPEQGLWESTVLHYLCQMKSQNKSQNKV